MRAGERWRRAVALSVVLVAAVAHPTLGESAEPRPELVIRCDDVGMCHSVNLAVRRVLATGIPFSVSVMVACPWFSEAAAILRDAPEVSVGIHLTLNSEWQDYRWGPVLGASAVPSLVDENGYFISSGSEFAAHAVDLGEVERELRAQIRKALSAGLQVDYLDYHMLTAVSTPELRAIVERLAAEFGLGLSRYFGEHSASLWDVAPERKLSNLMRVVDRVRSGQPNLLVIHLGLESREMQGLIDANYPADPFRVAQHRQAELDALTSPAFRAAIERKGIRLLTYRDLLAREGRGGLRWPGDAAYDSTGSEDED
jgi:predicted glycoside hydrolase/deacetylase ChbG (UPF0249 family)